MKRNTKVKINVVLLSSVFSFFLVFSIFVGIGLSKYYFFPVFLVSEYILYNVFNNKIINNNFNFKKFFTFLFLSFFLVCVHTNTLFYTKNKIVLTPKPSQIDNKTNEVWLCDLYSLNDNIDVIGNDEWIYKENCWVYNGTNKTPIIINPGINNNINLLFIKHNYSSGIEVSQDKNKDYFDLYSNEFGTESINVTIESNFLFSGRAFFITSLIVISIATVLYAMSLYNKKMNYLIILSIIISNILFFTISDKITAIILYITYLLCGYCFIVNYKNLLSNFNKFERILFYAITFLINYLCFGSIFFLYNLNVAYEINMFSLVMFIYTYVITMCVEVTAFYIFDYISKYLIKDKNKSKNNNYIFLFLCFCMLLIYAIVFYPGNLSSDSVSQVLDGVNGTITDAHPAIMTIIIRFIMKITNNFFFYIILQSIYFSVVVYKIFNYLNKKGVNKKLLIVLSIIIPLTPNIAMNNSTIWKDIIYSVSILLLSYYTYRIVIKEDKDLYDCGNILLFIISFIFTKEFRHNGLAPFLLVSVLLVIVSIIRKNKKLFILIIISIMLSTFGINALYKVYNVKHIQLGGSIYNSIVRNFAATIYYDKELSNEAYELIKPIGNKEYFKKYYNPTNIDYLFYSSEDSVYNWLNVVNNFKMIDVIPIYIKNIIKNPDVFIRDRYDSMAIMIDASYSSNYSDYSSYYDGIYADDNMDIIKYSALNNKNLKQTDNGYIIKSKISNFFRLILNLTTNNILLSHLFWRAGLFFISFIILFVYLIIKKKPLFILGMMPIIGNTLSWILVLNHPSVRYVYYLNMSFIFMLLLSLVALKEAKK